MTQDDEIARLLQERQNPSKIALMTDRDTQPEDAGHAPFAIVLSGKAQEKVDETSAATTTGPFAPSPLKPAYLDAHMSKRKMRRPVKYSPYTEASLKTLRARRGNRRAVEPEWFHAPFGAHSGPDFQTSEEVSYVDTKRLQDVAYQTHYNHDLRTDAVAKILREKMAKKKKILSIYGIQRPKKRIRPSQLTVMRGGLG